MKSIRLSAALGAAVLLLACDPYECSAKTCSTSGLAWKYCVLCSSGGTDTLCTYQARDASGATLSSCDYKSCGNVASCGPRDTCYNQIMAAAGTYCGGTP